MLSSNFDKGNMYNRWNEIFYAKLSCSQLLLVFFGKQFAARYEAFESSCAMRCMLYISSTAAISSTTTHLL